MGSSSQKVRHKDRHSGLSARRWETAPPRPRSGCGSPASGVADENETLVKIATANGLSPQ